MNNLVNPNQQNLRVYRIEAFFFIRLLQKPAHKFTEKQSEILPVIVWWTSKLHAMQNPNCISVTPKSFPIVVLYDKHSNGSKLFFCAQCQKKCYLRTNFNNCWV